MSKAFIISKPSSLEILKQTFERIIPSQDTRATINPLEFIVCLVFCYLGDSKTFALESMRRYMKGHLDKEVSRGSFWERLSRNRLKHYLRDVVAELMSQFSAMTLKGNGVLKALGVTAIWVIDSSTITLHAGAKKYFPGTGAAAGIKWHACFDVLNGTLNWFQLSASRTHDRKCFPEASLLTGKLIIFDLGYWDFGLLLALEKANVFFLSRLKSDAVIHLTKVVQGLSKKSIGQSLLSLDMSAKKGNIIEAFIKKAYKGKTLHCRAIGFWNPAEKGYHWYLTNLTVAAYMIYPLYRIRWQIELIFKACKNSLNANQIPSANKNIIESVLLTSLAAHLSTYTILNHSISDLDEAQQQAISFQRIAKVAVEISGYFVLFLLNSSTYYRHHLIQKIKLFANDLFDPNYKHRETSLMRIYRLLELES